MNPDGSPTDLCQVQSFFNSFSSISSFLWTISIALYLYISIVQRDTARADRYVTAMHLVCWGVPAVVITIAAGLGQLGYNAEITPGWCWLRHSSAFWIIVTGKGWEIVAYVASPILYAAVKHAIKRANRSGSEEQLLVRRACAASQEADKKLVFVPILFLLLRIWGTVRSICHLAGAQSPFWLVLLQVSFLKMFFSNC